MLGSARAMSTRPTTWLPPHTPTHRAACSAFAAGVCRWTRVAMSSPGMTLSSTTQRPATITGSARWAPRSRGHQRGGDAERRAGRQRDLHHRIRPRVVVARDQTRAVGQDGVLVLHHAVRRQATIALGSIHRPARQHHPDAQSLRCRDLQVDREFKAGWKDVMMVPPSKAWISPGFTVRSMASFASNDAYCLVTPRGCSRGGRKLDAPSIRMRPSCAALLHEGASGTASITLTWAATTRQPSGVRSHVCI